MKKLLLITGIFLTTLGVKSQNQSDVGLNLYGGYTFQDKIYSNNAYLEIQDAFQYGAGLEFYLRPTKSIELKYLRMDTKTPLFAPNPINVSQINVGNDDSAINYAMIGANNYFKTGSSNVIPFAGFDLGVGWASGDSSSNAKFSWDVKAGVKIKASDAVAVKLQAYFQTIYATHGSDAVWYPGWGTVYYPRDASLYQFGLGAALAFDFKH